MALGLGNEKRTVTEHWRALALLAPNGDRLLCVGDSSSQVTTAYAQAYGEVLSDEDRPKVKCISLQRWTGTERSGHWVHTSFLELPASAK